MLRRSASGATSGASTYITIHVVVIVDLIIHSISIMIIAMSTFNCSADRLLEPHLGLRLHAHAAPGDAGDPWLLLLV